MWLRAVWTPHHGQLSPGHSMQSELTSCNPTIPETSEKQCQDQGSVPSSTLDINWAVQSHPEALDSVQTKSAKAVEIYQILLDAGLTQESLVNTLWSGQAGTGWLRSKKALDDEGIWVRRGHIPAELWEDQLIAPSGLPQRGVCSLKRLICRGEVILCCLTEAAAQI